MSDTDSSDKNTGDDAGDQVQLKPHEIAVPITDFNIIENKLLQAEKLLRNGRVVDAHEEVTEAHRKLSSNKEANDD